MARRLLRVLLDPGVAVPARDGILLCEGLRRPVRSAEWRVIGMVPDALLALARAERLACEELASARKDCERRATYLDPAEAREARAIARQRVEDAIAAHRKADRAWREAAMMLVDAELGCAMIPADAEGLQFVRHERVVS